VAYAQDDGFGGPFDFGQKFREAISDILGISVEEYDAAVDQARDQVVDEALTEGWLTEDQAERMRERFDQGFGRRGMGKGFIGPHMDFMGRGGDSLIGMIAEELDMSVQDLLAELQDGKSLAEVAQENGVDALAIADAYLIQLEENLNQAVEDGKITENQANWMLEQAQEHVPALLENTWEGHCWPGGRRGGFMGFPARGA
jgi:hypothetical protein